MGTYVKSRKKLLAKEEELHDEMETYEEKYVSNDKHFYAP